MNRGDFLPEYTSVPTGSGYRPAYRLFVGAPLRLVPNAGIETSSVKATAAAKAYVRRKLNPDIRASQESESPDPLGISGWLEDRAGEADRRQEQAFGAIYRRGRKIVIEKRRRLG